MEAKHGQSEKSGKIGKSGKRGRVRGSRSVCKTRRRVDPASPRYPHWSAFSLCALCCGDPSGLPVTLASTTISTNERRYSVSVLVAAEPPTVTNTTINGLADAESVSSGYSTSPLLRISLSLSPARPCSVHSRSLRFYAPSYLPRSKYYSALVVLSYSRPRSTLRSVIKQPRGRQIESVEETRERRRRGDGQPAATMVSIVKGLSCRVRAARKPREGKARQSNEERNTWIRS